MRILLGQVQQELKTFHVPTLNMDRIRVDIDGDIEEITDIEFLVLWQLQDINPFHNQDVGIFHNGFLAD